MRVFKECLIVGFLIAVCCVPGRADEKAAPPQSAAGPSPQSSPGGGVLPKIQKYFVAHNDVAVRSGPSNRNGQLFAVSSGQEVEAVGEFTNYDAVADGELSQLWIRIKTPDGQEGFIPRRDLHSSTQQEIWIELEQRGQILSDAFDRAEKSTGFLAKFSGVYCPTLCQDPSPYSPNSLSLRSSLVGRYLIWFEDAQMHRVNVFNPREHWVSQIAASDELISFGDDAKPGFQGIKTLQSYKIVNQDGTTDYFAFTEARMFYRDSEKRSIFRYFVRQTIAAEKRKLLADYYVKAREVFPAENVK
jgi:SH3-like domain-containing protein